MVPTQVDPYFIIIGGTIVVFLLIVVSGRLRMRRMTLQLLRRS